MINTLKIWPRTLVLGLFILSLSSCLTKKMVKDFNFTGKTMGTYYRVKHSGDVEFETIKNIKKDIEVHLNHINSLMSTYIPSSQIFRFNQLQSTIPFTIHPDFLYVVKMSKKVHRMTEGFFDMTVMPLVNLWGFGPEGKKSPPSDQEVKNVLSFVGDKLIVVDEEKKTIKKTNPKTSIDLSAIAKGYGVDYLLEKLVEKYNLKNLIVEIGGEVRTKGLKRDGSNWKIGIESPSEKLGEKIQLVTSLSDLSMATSGSYRNYYESGGKKYSHTINISTGKPVKRDVISATVIHKKCLLADAWATALVAAGSQRGVEMAFRNKLLAYFIIKGEKEPRVLMTPKMEQYLAKYKVK